MLFNSLCHLPCAMTMICAKHAVCVLPPTAEATTDFLRRAIGQGDAVSVEIVYTSDGIVIGLASEVECLAITGVPAAFKRFLRSHAVPKVVFGPELELDFPVKVHRLYDLQGEVAEADTHHPSSWKLPTLEEAEMIYFDMEQQCSYAECVICTACRIRDLEVVMHNSVV